MNQNSQNIIFVNDNHDLIRNVIISRRADFALPFSVGNSKTVNVPIGKITHVVSDGVLSRFHMHGFSRESLYITNSIGDCSHILKRYAFIRIHRSFLVNCSFVNRIEWKRNGILHLINGEKFPISRRRKIEINRSLKRIGFTHLLED